MKNMTLLLAFLLLLSACTPEPAAQPNTPIPTTTSGRSLADQLTAAPPTAIPLTPTITLSPAPSATHTQTLPPSPTPEPTARRGATIDIFCLSVTQALENSTLTPNEPISETLGRVLAGTGLTFIPDSDACDAVLRLDLIFTPRSYEYQVEGSNKTLTCFTGASLRGTADLNWQGSSLYHRDLKDEFVPAGAAGGCPTAEEAPFGSVWPAAAMRALTEIWGKNVLVPALTDPFRIVREAAAQSLYLLSAAETLDFLPLLSTTLSDDSEVVRLRVLEALQRSVIDDPQPVAELTPQLLDLLAVETHPEAAQRAVDLLVRFARDHGRSEQVADSLRQILEESPPYPEGNVPNLMILGGIEDLGPLALDTAPALIELLREADDLRYSQQIQAALRAVSGQDFGADAGEWQSWWGQRSE